MPPHQGSLEDRRAQAQEALDCELARIVESGEYAAWFAKLASFHRYSATNTMWILAQRPDASRVASYRTWQEVGRQVCRGEAGIQIFHPKPYWIDPATGERVRPPSNDTDRARLTRKVTFSIGHVFDISQTEGEPLELGRPAPADAPQALADHLDSYCTDHRVTVAVSDLPTGLAGYYQRDGDKIVLATSSSPGERVATLAHELAHREDPDLQAAHTAGDRSFYRHNRADCEAVAEAAAHAVSARFGHDITAHAAGYIAGWVDGDVDRLRELHARVGQVTTALVPPDRLDRMLTAAHSRSATRTNPGRGRARVR